MSLRAILILWIGLVLIASLFVGGVMVYWHAVQKVDVEMRAAIAVGEHTIHNAVDDVEEAAAPLRQLRLLVADLDGDRHLRGTLFAPDDGIGLQPDGNTVGLELTVMRERVNSLGGELKFTVGLDGRGVAVSARLRTAERVT